MLHAHRMDLMQCMIQTGLYIAATCATRSLQKHRRPRPPVSHFQGYCMCVCMKTVRDTYTQYPSPRVPHSTTGMCNCMCAQWDPSITSGMRRVLHLQRLAPATGVGGTRGNTGAKHPGCTGSLRVATAAAVWADTLRGCLASLREECRHICIILAATGSKISLQRVHGGPGKSQPW